MTQFSVKHPKWIFWRPNFTSAQIHEGLAKGSIKKDWVICPVGEANRAVPIETFLRNPFIFDRSAHNSGGTAIGSSVACAPTPPNSRSLFLRQVRSASCYPWLRSINEIVFCLHCGLIVLASLLGLFVLGWSNALGFWSLFVLVAIAIEAGVVAMALRAAAEMAVDVADCVVERTRLASAADRQPLSITPPASR